MEAILLEQEATGEDYRRIEAALVYLAESYPQQPGLKEVANQLGLSEYYFQRLFTRFVGISPKRFVQYLTKERAKQLLEKRYNLLETAYESGLSGPGRLHDLFVTWEAVTPGEYKNRGAGLELLYGFHPSPLGECLVALSERGITNLVFVEAGGRGAALEELRSRWRRAQLVESAADTWPVAWEAFRAVERNERKPLQLFLSGTNFQLKVWEAILRVPPGAVVTYQDLAEHIGSPGAARAVGNAVGRNPVPVIVPCHRVIRKMGALGGYRYGLERKRALLAWEWARREAGQADGMAASS